MPQTEHKIKPNTTSVSNLFLDNMEIYSGNEVKVFMFLSRKTSGWHKETQWASISYIKKGTGIGNKNGVITAINTLLKDGWIQRNEKKVRGGISYVYLLNGSVDMKEVRKRTGTKTNRYESGTGTKSIPLKQESGTKFQESGTKSIHNKRNNNKRNNNLKETILSSGEDSGKPPGRYGDSGLSRVFEEGLRILNIPKYDGSVKENRKNASIAINKFKDQGGEEAVLSIFKASTQSPFWSGKITSFSDVLKHGVKVVNSLHEKKEGRLAYV